VKQLIVAASARGECRRDAEMIGAAPDIGVNLGLGSIGDARDRVEYTNGAKQPFTGCRGTMPGPEDG
jgi:alpha-L-arabinofuranosidase